MTGTERDYSVFGSDQQETLFLCQSDNKSLQISETDYKYETRNN